MEKYEMYDRIMPNQEALLHYYKHDKGELGKRIFDACCKYSCIENVDNVGVVFPEEFFGQQYMGTDPVTRKFQCILLQLINAKNVLEIGTFVGVSTMAFAKTIGTKGKVWTIEKYDKFAKLARENFKNHKVENIILLEGDVQEQIAVAIKECKEKFDFVFLDGSKENYLNYFKIVWERLNKNGIIMVDGGFFDGDVLNDEQTTPKGEGVKKLLDFVKDFKEAAPLLLPCGAGIFMVMRQEIC